MTTHGSESHMQESSQALKATCNMCLEAAARFDAHAVFFCENLEIVHLNCSTGRAVGRDDAVRGAADKGREGQSVLSKDVKDEATRRRRLPELWYGHGTRRGMAVMGACVAWDRSG